MFDIFGALEHEELRQHPQNVRLAALLLQERRKWAQSHWFPYIQVTGACSCLLPCLSQHQSYAIMGLGCLISSSSVVHVLVSRVQHCPGSHEV